MAAFDDFIAAVNRLIRGGGRPLPEGPSVPIESRPDYDYINESLGTQFGQEVTSDYPEEMQGQVEGWDQFFPGAIVVQDDYGERHYHGLEEWHYIAKLDTSDLERYNNGEFLLGGSLIIDQWTIIKSLEARGLWTDEDWAEWRATVESDGAGNLVYTGGGPLIQMFVA